jgi:type IV secretion system protein VirB1
VPLDPVAFLALAPACAPAVAPTTLLAIAQVESGLDPFAIGVNGRSPRRLTFSGQAAATRGAKALLAQGLDIDLGLAQINARNLERLDLTIEAAFDPCRNLAASAQVLKTGYLRAGPAPGAEQAALRTAFSYYNTGRPDRGFANGYVARVIAAANQIVPRLAARHLSSRSVTTAPSLRRPWDAFGDLSAASFVVTLSPLKPGAIP